MGNMDKCDASCVVEIAAAELRRAVGQAGILTPRRAALPIGECLILTVCKGNNTATLTGGSCGAQIESCLTLAGPAPLYARVAVPLRILRQMTGMRDFQAWQLRIDDACARLRISALSGTLLGQPLRLEIGLWSAGDFPPPPTMAPGADDMAFGVSAGRLRDWLAVLLTAASDEETRYYLNGVYVEPGQSGQVLGTSTDGRRLMHLPVTPEVMESAAARGAIWPREVVQAVLPLLVTDSPVMVRQSAGHVEISGRDWVVRARTVDGTFPEYRRVIPPPSGNVVAVKAGQAVARTAWLARFASPSQSRANTVCLAWSTSDGCMHLQMALLVDAGTLVDVDLPMELQGGAWPVGVGFNGQYLRDVFAALARYSGADTITMDMAGASSPCTIRAGAALAVLMPMRI
jgi:DNA polymerase III sliding clamp (beta) subunit (PCNA family)